MQSPSAAARTASRLVATVVGLGIALSAAIAGAAEPTPAPGPQPVQTLSAARTEAAADLPQADVFYGRTNPAVGATVMALGIVSGVAAGAVTHAALTPRCADRSDMMTCELPDSADLRRRGGLLVAGPVLAIGGGVMGGVGARSMMRNLDPDVSTATLARRQRVATAVGAVSIVVGTTAAIVGPTVFAVGARRVTAKPDVGATSSGVGNAVVSDIEGRMKGLALARSGIALSLAAPTFIALGAALIRNRPESKYATRLAPQLGPNFAGVTVSGRF